MKIKTSIGQDSHRFDPEDKEKKLILGGITFEGEPPLKANSDGDVILHSLINAISGISGEIILGKKADEMCEKGITDSKIYLKEALKTITDWEINHISISLECRKPKLLPKIEEIREKIANLCGIKKEDIMITATTGENLTPFGKGEGIQSICILTVSKKSEN